MCAIRWCRATSGRGPSTRWARASTRRCSAAWTVAEGFRACGRCERCRYGETSLCTAGYDETGFTRPGAFADHLVVPARLLHPLADDADLRAAALLEPAAVVAAAVRAGTPEPGERIAVLGAGTLGLLAVQLLAAVSPHGAHRDRPEGGTGRPGAGLRGG